jgi:hypothetical protein
MGWKINPEHVAFTHSYTPNLRNNKINGNIFLFFSDMMNERLKNWGMYT